LCIEIDDNNIDVKGFSRVLDVHERSAYKIYAKYTKDKANRANPLVMPVLRGIAP